MCVTERNGKFNKLEIFYNFGVRQTGRFYSNTRRETTTTGLFKQGLTNTENRDINLNTNITVHEKKYGFYQIHKTYDKVVLYFSKYFQQFVVKIYCFTYRQR